MSFANDMLCDAAQNEMLKAGASVGNHYDQIYSESRERPARYRYQAHLF